MDASSPYRVLLLISICVVPHFHCWPDAGPRYKVQVQIMNTTTYGNQDKVTHSESLFLNNRRQAKDVRNRMNVHVRIAEGRFEISWNAPTVVSWIYVAKHAKPDATKICKMVGTKG